MAEVSQVKQQISQAKQRAKQQRQELQERMKQAKEAEQKVQQEREKLPKPTQRRLRSGLYSGLEGRRRRREVSQAREKLGEKKQQVGRFKKELQRYEKEELKPFEQKISKREKELKEYEKHQKALERAKKIASGEAPGLLLAYSSNLVQDYYKRIKAGEKAQIKAQTPESPGSLSADSRPIVGGERKDMTPDPSIFKQVGSTPGGGGIWVKKDSLSSMPSISKSPPRDLSRTELLKDFSSLQKSDISKVSKGVSGVLDKKFRTTGSPLRMTKLTSLESKGYTPKPKAPARRDRSPKSSFDMSQAPKAPSSGSNLFSSKTKKKKSKKKKELNIWGL